MQTRNTPEYWNAAPAVWKGDSPLVCCQITVETHDVKSFHFKPLQAALFRFQPGQFITLELSINGQAINRSYTIASAPTQPEILTLTIKRKPGGLVSNWMHDHLQVGDQLSALGPSGQFSSAQHSAQRYLFLSGGSGITPLMSMARAFHGLAEMQDIAFVHSARSPSDIIFRQELALMSAQAPSFKQVFICEQMDAAQAGNALPDELHTGLLDIGMLQAGVADFHTREIFTCGPAPYMAAVRDMLRASGFDMAHYHEESFNFDEMMVEQASSASSPDHAPAAAQESGFSIYFSKSDTTVQCAPDQFILQAARAAGLPMPSSCSKGLCGTCKSKMTSGQVDMQHGGGIRQREIDQGMILPCCSIPLANLVIER